MAKKVTGYIKLQIPAGKATPAPPVGPALGQHGVNIVQFTKEFNARTADQGDLIIPVVITVYADRSFSFITKTPPAAVLLKKAAKIKSGSGVPNKTKVAKVTMDVGTLNLLAKKNENVSVVMYTLKRTKLSQGDVDNFNSQYPSLEVRYTKVFHDRFLILDKKNAYHIGASLKDAGKKCFGITLLEDDGIVRDILQRLELETEE